MKTTTDTPIDRVLSALDGVTGGRSGQYEARCPAHDDRSPSLSVKEGDDGRVLLNCHAGCSTRDVVAAMQLELSDLFPEDADDSWKPWEGTEVEAYDYTNADGAVQFQVVRYEMRDTSHPACGQKQFVQRSYLPEHPEAGRNGCPDGFVWGRTKHDVDPTLYQLPDVLQGVQDGRGVFIVEGEKDVHTLEQRGLIATTNPQGAGKWRRAYTDVLEDAIVYIIPDNDSEGREHARRVARSLHGTADSVRIVELDDVPPKGDVTDWMQRGHDVDDLRAKVGSAGRWSPSEDVAEHGPAGRNGQAPTAIPSEGKSETQAQVLIRLAEPAELWQTPDGDSYATFPVRDTKRTAPLRQKPFRQWLRHRFYNEQGKPPGSQALQDTIDTLAAQAEFGDTVRPVHLRVAGDVEAERRVVIDRGDRSWEAVEITPNSVQTTTDPAARFRRVKSMKALPEPNGSGDPASDLEKLRKHVRVSTDEDFALLLAWLVQALSPTGPYPVLVMTGEQGSGKSFAAKFLRSLIDPSAVPTSSAPHKERDLIVTAENSWVLNFDNLSGVNPWLSDALCRLATGGGFRARKLYTDAEESVFYNQRPIILNGIEDMTGRPDLADRSIVINFDPIPKTERKTERELERAFAEDRPAIFSGLCHAVACALGCVDDVDLPTLPRMADFAKWAEAAEPAFPVEAGTFRDAYAENRQAANESALENDAVARAIVDLVDDRGKWHGKMSDLVDALGEYVFNPDDPPPEMRSFQALSSHFKRIRPVLREVGVRRRDDQQERSRAFTLYREEDDEDDFEPDDHVPF